MWLWGVRQCGSGVTVVRLCEGWLAECVEVVRRCRNGMNSECYMRVTFNSTEIFILVVSIKCFLSLFH